MSPSLLTPTGLVPRTMRQRRAENISEGGLHLVVQQRTVVPAPVLGAIQAKCANPECTTVWRSRQIPEAGVRSGVVSERMGHASPELTLHRYSHVMPGMLREPADDCEGGEV